MNTTKSYYYHKVAQVLEYLENNFTNQPCLEEIAEQVNISPFHFQRIFSEWVGVSPKKYLQFLNVSYAKSILSHNTLENVAFHTGLSGTGRLHDMFVKIEGMTPGEYKNGGKALDINYQMVETIFGDVVVASTAKGICHIGFREPEEKHVAALFDRFPNANFIPGKSAMHENVVAALNADFSNRDEIKLHLKGTNFQLKVWQALLQIPMGSLSTYGDVAQQIGKPKASRAVGSAIGKNPVAFLIPCHRVIQQSGSFGQYHWDPTRKKAIIGWEAAQCSSVDACLNETQDACLNETQDACLDK